MCCTMQYFHNSSSYVWRNNIDLPWIFYLNSFLLYIIVISFWRVFYMIYPINVFNNQNTKEFYWLRSFYFVISIIRFGSWSGRLSLSRGLWNRVILIFPSFSENLLTFSSFAFLNKIFISCKNKTDWCHLQAWLMISIWKQGKDHLCILKNGVAQEWSLVLPHISIAIDLWLSACWNHLYVQYIVFWLIDNF